MSRVCHNRSFLLTLSLKTRTPHFVMTLLTPAWSKFDPSLIWTPMNYYKNLYYSYRWTSRVWETTCWSSSRLQEHLPIIFRGIYRVYLRLIRRNRRLAHVTGWTRKQKDLHRICPTISPDTAQQQITTSSPAAAAAAADCWLLFHALSAQLLPPTPNALIDLLNLLTPLLQPT